MHTYFQAKNLLQDPTIQHGFFTRQGGISSDLYHSLNCGINSQDQDKNTVTNRDIALKKINLENAHLITLNQVHGAISHFVDKNTHQRLEGDGLVTNKAQVALSINTADCVPVLFCDPHTKVIGAAHAGWRGAISGIIESTIDAMIKIGANPQHIHAAIGPSIDQENYQVDNEFYQNLLKLDHNNQQYFDSNLKFNLKKFVYDKLRAHALASIEDLNLDTYTQPDLFFSCRRATHKGDSDFGRQISIICLR